MDQQRHRAVIVIAALVLIAGSLACSTSTLLSRRDEATVTPTKTPKPTFTATLTPTETPIPTDTPVPTNTPTPEIPTNTPVIQTATFTPEPPTNTPVPSDTATPVPPTNTPRPTSPPRPRATNTPKPPPAPTNTPKPAFPWTGQIDFSLQNCALTRVLGFTLDRAGGLAGDKWVHYWADGWDGDWAKTLWTDFGAGTTWKGDEGNWDGVLWPNGPRPGSWHVCVADADDSWTCVSNTVTFTTDDNCTTGAQIVHVTFRQN